MRARKFLVLISLGVVGGACGGSNNQTQIDAPSADSNIDAGLPPGFYTIQQIENPSMAAGTAVGVTNVVVTAIDMFGTTNGNFWVEEPGGGMFSGILVYDAPFASVEALTVGSVVSIANGEKALFASSSDTSGRTDPEIIALNGGTLEVTAIGTQAVPAPMVVDALAIGQMQGEAAEAAGWAPYNGVLITVDNVSVLSHPECIGSCKDNTDDSFEITGALIDVESELAALPGAGSGSSDSAGEGTLVRGDCLASVTGVLDYFEVYDLLPRATTDIATGGTACPAPEQANGSDGTLCTDGIDNDANGFTDCNDDGCAVGSAAWLDPDNCNAAVAGLCGCSMNLVAGTAVSTINAGTKGPVLVNTVFVTAVSTTGYWISDALQAAQNHGMFVFQDSTPSVTVGQQLSTIQGIVKPFDEGSGSADLAELELDDPTTGTATVGGTPLPILQANAPIATVTSVANGGAFQGSLVQFNNVSVTVAPTSTNHEEATLTDGTNTFVMAAGAFSKFTGATTAVGTCYTSLTGVMDLDTFDPQVRTINPRSVSDMVVGTGCP